MVTITMIVIVTGRRDIEKLIAQIIPFWQNIFFIENLIIFGKMILNLFLNYLAIINFQLLSCHHVSSFKNNLLWLALDLTPFGLLTNLFIYLVIIYYCEYYFMCQHILPRLMSARARRLASRIIRECILCLSNLNEAMVKRSEMKWNINNKPYVLVWFAAAEKEIIYNVSN